MEKFEITSQLFPCVSVDTYHSALSLGDLEEHEEENGDLRPFDYADGDVEEYEKYICGYAKEWIDDEVLPKMKKYGVEGLEVVSLHSPSEYNFTTDRLNIDAVMSDGWRELMHENLQNFTDKKFAKYIHSELESRDGFISFMPTTYEEIERMDDEIRCVSVYLTLCLLNEFNDCEEFAEFYRESQSFIEVEMYEQFPIGRENALEDEYPEVAESLLSLYDAYDFDIVYWKLAEKIGFPWLDKRICKPENWRLREAENDGQKMLVWAGMNGYDAKELRRMSV